MIPEGKCQCGCGADTPIAQYGNWRFGRVKGKPLRFVNGHQSRTIGPAALVPNVPYGHCHCGCGRLTRVAHWSDRTQGLVKGQPVRFISGHNNRLNKVIRHRPDPVARAISANQQKGAHRSIPGYTVEDRGYATPCWIFQGHIGKRGYGKVSIQGPKRSKNAAAHRVYYERAKGQIPTGLELHHKCRQRPCVNPEHLEPVTHEEHMKLTYPSRRSA